ncbi:hypothetical protein JG688_00016849, partial [Phytophthora aleatoria]
MQNNDCWFFKNTPPETNGPCQAKRTASPRRTRAPRAAIQSSGRICWKKPSSYQSKCVQVLRWRREQSKLEEAA